jgi:hypothetical protein
MKGYQLTMFGGTIGAAAEVLLIWGFARDLWSLAAFATLYGATAGGYAVLRPLFAEAIVGGQDEKEQNLLVFGILTALRGAAIIASGFVAERKLDETSEIGSGYGGGKWEELILYTGMVLFASSLVGGLGVFIRTAKTSTSASTC